MICVTNLNEHNKFREGLQRILYTNIPNIFVCIGTPRVSFDAVSPEIGTILKDSCLTVYGTKTQPIHRKNYEEYYNKLKELNKSYNIIAIDTALTQDSDYYHTVSISEGGIKPAQGLGIDMKPIGDYSIKISLPSQEIQRFLLFDIPLSNNTQEFLDKSIFFVAYNILQVLGINKRQGVI